MNFTQKLLLMQFGTPILVIILLVVLLVLIVSYFISTQRKLVDLQEMTKNALGQIAVQVNSRFDALTQLAKVCTGYAKHESETIMGVIRERRVDVNQAQVSNLTEAEAASQSILSRLFAVAESYPELKASTIYQDLMNSVNQYENNVRIQRMVYNDAATRLNRKVRMFPSSMVAKRLGFDVIDYFQADAGKNQMPDLNLEL